MEHALCQNTEVGAVQAVEDQLQLLRGIVGEAAWGPVGQDEIVLVDPLLDEVLVQVGLAGAKHHPPVALAAALALASR